VTAQPSKSLLASVAVLVVLTGALAFGAEPVAVEPSELAKRTDLVGREVVVDDRVSYFQFHKGSDFDEIVLKRTPVVFRLPPRLRLKQSPRPATARVRGILKRDGDRQIVCDVTELTLLPNDLERLERGIAALPASDFEGRSAWAHWAERRGAAFQDSALVDRGRAIEDEAIRSEADRASADPPARWLELARRARRQQIPEPAPSALGHRAFRARLASAADPETLKALVADIEAFWPDAPKRPPAGSDASAWLAPYADDPAAAIRGAPGPARAVLNHRLWADATERLLEAEAAARPADAMALADRAEATLGDRPEVAARLLDLGLKAAARNLGTLRQREVEELARVYRERLHQPERALSLIRDWLDERRDHHLSPTDAEGRVALAAQYQALLDDRAAAVELLREAWKIDPGSKEVAAAFRARGYRKVDDVWVEPPDRADSDAGAGETPRDGSARGPALRESRIIGSTPSEVRVRLGGKPDRISRLASQGQVIEQWIYVGPRENRYVNFLRSARGAQPRAVAYYSIPRSPRDVASQPR
jgi:hypothetical protein